MNITRVLAFRTEMEVMTLLMTLLLNVSLVKKVIIKKGTTVMTITILNKTTRQSKASFFITVIKI